MIFHDFLNYKTKGSPVIFRFCGTFSENQFIQPTSSPFGDKFYISIPNCGNELKLKVCGLYSSLFSRRFSREKCPTLTVASFLFVRQQTSSRMYHFLQTSLSLTCTRQYSVYGEPSGHGFESLL